MKEFGQRERFGSHLGLERIELLCAALDNPQADLKFIHVAGTNGKGSVSAFLSHVLRQAGYRVGLFTSPHLEHYRERFKINGSCIEPADLDRLVALAEAACSQVEAAHPEVGPITEFELATAVSFLYFQEAKVDIVVLETGLGGRLDSTNIVSPILTVITTISHDHTDRLGASLREIAHEKGGIIKNATPIISGVEPGEAEIVLRKIAEEKNAPWRSIYNYPWQSKGWSLAGGDLFFPPWGDIQIGLLGEHQIRNGATALLALRELAALGWDIPETGILQGMKELQWPGRLEVISRSPLILLDGGHNGEGIAALEKSLAQLEQELDGKKFTFVVGMLQTKDPALLDPLLARANRFVFTQADSGRFPPMEPAVLVEYAHSKGFEAVAYPDIGQALADAITTDPVCICGSLYLVGTVKRYLRDKK